MDNSNKKSAKMAILQALYDGRKLSQLDCKEFEVEDMRTPVSHLKPFFENTHILRKEWIVTPVHKARIRQYSLERKEGGVAHA